MDREEQLRQVEQARIAAAVETGHADPAGDAARAAGEGRFALIWGLGLGWRSPLGVNCRFPEYAAGTNRTPLLSAYVVYNDVVPSPSEAEQVRRLGDYAAAYNRAVAAHPRFPYADLCTDSRPARRDPPTLEKPETLAADARVESDAPRNLGEAARRGTLASVKRLVSRPSREDIDRSDDFGLAPLAWAVIEHRSDVAAALIAKGADPLTASPRFAGSPLRIALLTRQQDLATAMITPDVARGLDDSCRPGTTTFGRLSRNQPI